MNFRHEWKHRINYADLLAIRQRLRIAAKPDSHAVNGKYFIRSLYFDTPADTALREKIDGVNQREKFRIRFYNWDTSFIHLEKKSKYNGLCNKMSCLLSPQEAAAVGRGEMGWMLESGRSLVQELYNKMICQELRPKTIVDYTREAFIYAPGNVRITLDYDIRTGLGGTDFLNPACVTIPAGDAPIILEVKWDSFLPEIMRDVVQLEHCHTAAFSKYAACRTYC